MPSPSLRIVFDLDDTLYPERSFALSGFRAAGTWADAEFGVTGMAAEMTRLFEEGQLGPLFKQALTSHVPEHGPEHLEGLVEIYRTHAPEIMLFDDGQWALEHYARHGPLGLITDGTTDMQAGKVRALDIEHLFAEIILTDALGGRQFRKPHPLSYERIEAAIGGDDVQLVYVGDNPAKDFIIPNAKGWITIQVKRAERGIHDPDAIAEGGAPQHLISSLRDLPNILDM